MTSYDIIDIIERFQTLIAAALAFVIAYPTLIILKRQVDIMADTIAQERAAAWARIDKVLTPLVHHATFLPGMVMGTHIETDDPIHVREWEPNHLPPIEGLPAWDDDTMLGLFAKVAPARVDEFAELLKAARDYAALTQDDPMRFCVPPEQRDAAWFDIQSALSRLWFYGQRLVDLSREHRAAKAAA